MPHHPSPETITICLYFQFKNEAEGPASKWTIQYPIWVIIKVRKKIIIWNQERSWAKAPLQNDKSSVPASKSGNDHNLSWKITRKCRLQIDKSNAPSSESRANHNLLFGMKLGRRPSFKMTSPALHHPSPETIIICHYAWSWRSGFKTPSPTALHSSPETIMICH